MDDQEHIGIISGGSSVQIGRAWEEWVSRLLSENNIPNLRLSGKSLFDILALGRVRIDVKVTTVTPSLRSKKFKSPLYGFAINEDHQRCDIFFPVIAETKEYFVIPASVIPAGEGGISIRWPYEAGAHSYAQYYKNLDIIREMATGLPEVTEAMIWGENRIKARLEAKNKKLISIRVSKDLHARIAKVAEREHRSVAAQTIYIVEQQITMDKLSIHD